MVTPTASQTEQNSHVEGTRLAEDNVLGEKVAELFEPSEVLLQIVNDIEQFLLRQIDRAGEILSQCEELIASAGSVHELRQRVEQERVDLQKKREKEEQRIAEVTQQLTEAFLRLEAERSHMNSQMKSLQAKTGLVPQATLHGTVSGGQLDRQTDLPLDPSNESTPALPAEARFELTNRQFHQLRREIGKHMSHGP
jgi:C4-dicarboxylate-specific signal transduction histidine kinase